MRGYLARKPEERLLKVVVGLGRDVVVLQVLLPVEGDLLGLHLQWAHTGQPRCKKSRGVAHVMTVRWQRAWCAPCAL